MNLTDLFDADGTTEDFSLDQLVHPMPCDAVSAPMCADGYTCIGTSCVADRLAPTGGTSFEVEALLSCLGVSERSENVPVVAMGGDHRPLCYLYRTSAREICSPPPRSADSRHGVGGGLRVIDAACAALR